MTYLDGPLRDYDSAFLLDALCHIQDRMTDGADAGGQGLDGFYDLHVEQNKIKGVILDRLNGTSTQDGDDALMPRLEGPFADSEQQRIADALAVLAEHEPVVADLHKRLMGLKDRAKEAGEVELAAMVTAVAQQWAEQVQKRLEAEEGEAG